jgi:N-acetylglucosamine-6-phosphate deacetylase
MTPFVEVGDGVVLIAEGKIVFCGLREAVELPTGTREYDAGEWTIAPGFVDIHIHGAGGHDVMQADEQGLRHIAETVARFGTTAYVATTVTASPDDTCRSLESLARAAKRQRAGTSSAGPAAELLGIHFEGPFISHVRRGVHPPEWIATPAAGLFERMLAAADGEARIITLAPELPGALELVERARAARMVASMGHTNATYEEAMAAIARGASHATHVFNAMRPFSHRDTGVLGAVLTHPEVTAEIIADGIHVDNAAIRILLAAKGNDRVILVTDAIAATAMPDGNYRLGTFEVSVTGGVCRDAEGHLAGSTLTLDRAVRLMVELGVPAIEAVRMATLQPAWKLGIESRKGALVAGADADLLFLDDALHVRGAMTHRMREPRIEP